MTRIVQGIRAHFMERVTEWIMAVPTGTIAVALFIDPWLLMRSPTYGVVSSFASDETWRWLIAFCFLVRVGALVVNGTFARFRYSPHLRSIASAICFNFWAWLSVCFLSAFTFAGEAFLAFPACMTLCMVEGLNIVRGANDIAHQHEGQRNGMAGATYKRTP